MLFFRINISEGEEEDEMENEPEKQGCYSQKVSYLRLTKLFRLQNQNLSHEFLEKYHTGLGVLLFRWQRSPTQVLTPHSGIGERIRNVRTHELR